MRYSAIAKTFGQNLQNYNKCHPTLIRWNNCFLKSNPKFITRSNNFQFRSNTNNGKPSTSTNTQKINPKPPSTSKVLSDHSFSTDQYHLQKSFGIGSVAGFLGSLAGMGGGFIIIPLLTMKKSIHFLNMKLPNLGLGVTQHVAHGTSLFAVCATGIAGGLGFGLQDIHIESVGALAISGMITARMGAKLISRLSQKQLKLGLGVFMIFVAPLVPLKPYIAKHFGGDQNQSKDHGSTDQTNQILKEQSQVNDSKFTDRIILPSIVGLGSGFISGIFGVGGGAVTVPALTIASDITHYQALCTSLCAMSLPALAGTVTHYQNGNVALRIAVPLACGAFLGGFTGGKVASKLPEDKLRWGFFALLLSLGSRNLMKAGAFRR